VVLCKTVGGGWWVMLLQNITILNTPHNPHHNSTADASAIWTYATATLDETLLPFGQIHLQLQLQLQMLKLTVITKIGKSVSKTTTI
jgi:hypothetical protein